MNSRVEPRAARHTLPRAAPAPRSSREAPAAPIQTPADARTPPVSAPARSSPPLLWARTRRVLYQVTPRLSQLLPQLPVKSQPVRPPLPLPSQFLPPPVGHRHLPPAHPSPPSCAHMHAFPCAGRATRHLCMHPLPGPRERNHSVLRRCPHRRSRPRRCRHIRLYAARRPDRTMPVQPVFPRTNFLHLLAN